MKGDYGDECNRMRCENNDAVFFNRSTLKYYCITCAIVLNKSNPDAEELFGGPLCVHHTERGQ